VTSTFVDRAFLLGMGGGNVITSLKIINSSGVGPETVVKREKIWRKI